MRELHNWAWVRSERGVSLITVMMVLFIMTLMGISILAITGFERQIAGSVSSSEASTDAAESCVSTGANVIQQSLQAHVVPTSFLANAVPPGPVPVENLAVLTGEIKNDGGNPDFPIGAGSAPNLAMTLGNYQVFGDIDRLYAQHAPGSESGNPDTVRLDILYQITCVAQNLATGITSQVGVSYICNFPDSYCQPRPY